MSAAIDTNILIDLLAGDAVTSRRARDTLDDASARGALVICPPVYAELLAFPGRHPHDVDAFLANTGVAVTWELAPSVWRNAGVAFARYAEHRRQAGGGQPRRLLVDFLVGAHAQEVGMLITRDLGFYHASYPDLRIITPA